MPRRTHVLAAVVALAAGLLLAVGLAACGDSGSSSAQTLERPPLTVGTAATLPAGTTPRTKTTTSTTPGDTGGAADTDPGGAPDTGGTADGGASGTPDPPDTGGGASDGTGDDTGAGTPTQPSNPGGAAPNFDEFCDENPGAC